MLQWAGFPALLFPMSVSFLFIIILPAKCKMDEKFILVIHRFPHDWINISTTGSNLPQSDRLKLLVGQLKKTQYVDMSKYYKGKYPHSSLPSGTPKERDANHRKQHWQVCVKGPVGYVHRVHQFETLLWWTLMIQISIMLCLCLWLLPPLIARLNVQR